MSRRRRRSGREHGESPTSRDRTPSDPSDPPGAGRPPAVAGSGPRAETRSSDREVPPDIEFDASVSAESLRFGAVPSSRVTYRGHPGCECHDGSDRAGLPRPVSEGVTYRDVRVDYRIVAALHVDQ